MVSFEVNKQPIKMQPGSCGLFGCYCFSLAGCRLNKTAAMGSTYPGLFLQLVGLEVLFLSFSESSYY